MLHETYDSDEGSVGRLKEDSEDEFDEDELDHFVDQVEGYAPELAKQNWRYCTFSERGALFAGFDTNVRTQQVRNDFELVYNPSDDELFKQTSEGMKHALKDNPSHRVHVEQVHGLGRCFT